MLFVGPSNKHSSLSLDLAQAAPAAWDSLFRGILSEKKKKKSSWKLLAVMLGLKGPTLRGLLALIHLPPLYTYPALCLTPAQTLLLILPLITLNVSSYFLF